MSCWWALRQEEALEGTVGSCPPPPPDFGGSSIDHTWLNLDFSPPLSALPPDTTQVLQALSLHTAVPAASLAAQTEQPEVWLTSCGRNRCLHSHLNPHLRLDEQTVKEVDLVIAHHKLRWLQVREEGSIRQPGVKSGALSLKHSVWGLPWRIGGKQFICQRRRHGFDPWSGKIPQATERVSPSGPAPELCPRAQELHPRSRPAAAAELPTP